MSDDDEVRSHLTNDVYLDMDDAFCARMRKAIVAGLSSRRLLAANLLFAERYGLVTGKG